MMAMMEYELRKKKELADCLHCVSHCERLCLVISDFGIG